MMKEYDEKYDERAQKKRNQPWSKLKKIRVTS